MNRPTVYQLRGRNKKSDETSQKWAGNNKKWRANKGKNTREISVRGKTELNTTTATLEKKRKPEEKGKENKKIMRSKASNQMDLNKNKRETLIQRNLCQGDLC